jgi:hypothetical protein
MACDVAVGSTATEVAVGPMGVGAGLVPDKEPQAERPKAMNRVNSSKIQRGWENICQIIPIKK